MKVTLGSSAGIDGLRDVVLSVLLAHGIAAVVLLFMKGPPIGTLFIVPTFFLITIASLTEKYFVVATLPVTLSITASTMSLIFLRHGVPRIIGLTVSMMIWPLGILALVALVGASL